MLRLELVCLAIVLAFVVVRARRDPQPGRFLLRLFLLAAAGWVAEDSVIHAYDFYAYAPEWTVFVDRVPLMVLVIWPVVIHSAWDLARHLLGPRHPRGPLLAAALVLADASLIEPIAVQAGLWRWHQPGLFGVPPIGILGWAFFAGLGIGWLDRIDRRGHRWAADLAVVLLPAVGTHLLLLATWWVALRWVNGSVPPWAGVAVAWSVSVWAARRALGSRARERVPRGEMLLRVPAAAFFFALLALHGAEIPALVVYALAFAPPYLGLVDLTAPRGSEARSPITA